MADLSLLVIKHAYIPVVLTAGYTLFVYRKLDKELGIFAWFIFLSALIQIVSALLWFQSRNNLPLLHLYVGAGFLCLAWFYSALLENYINKKIIWVVAWLFTFFTIVNAFFIQGIFAYASVSLTVESILVIILSLSTFIFLLDDIVKESKARIIKSLNWINSGLFLYYSSSLLLFYFGEVITHSFARSFSRLTFVLHFIFLTIMHACFFIGLWKRPSN